MIQLSSAGKRYGHKLLFENLDWLLTPQDRVGLVGANGTGKSTLLKILAGLETLDYGTLSVPKNLTTGYLPQDGLSLSERTVFEECMSVFGELRGMEHELQELAGRMAELDSEGAEYAAVAERYHRLEHEFRSRDGYALEAQAGTVLSGLGFRRPDWARPAGEFSGGWQMRIALARLLLEKPRLLLLDEPTNHLDLEARNWLEQYLGSYPHAFVLISHDRYFLDVTVNRIAEIWNKRVHFYSGNYETYLAQKAERRQQLEAAYRNQRERIEHLEAFIERFRYQATKARQVQSRVKELEKIERIELPAEERTIHFSFPQPRASGRRVAEFAGVEKRYGEHRVLKDASFVIERGERIALVGANGAGKSTLIKLLCGREPLTAGQFHLGHNVEVDFFAQDQYKELDSEARVLKDLERAAPQATQTELRNLLGCFLFSEDDVFKRIGVLSGGERNRYALARMLMRPSNFLLLDEPTNHLDLRAKEVLLEALAEFTGTIVFVSHDRYFIDKLATRVFEISERAVSSYPGNYEDYLWRKQNQAGGDAGRVTAASAESTYKSLPANGNGRPEVEAPATKTRRLNPIRLRQMQERCRELEEEVARLDAEVQECERALTVFVSAQETTRLTSLLAGHRRDLEERLAEWEEMSRVLESAGVE
jgi:ATP-binding cassette subfamily F protein 3